MDRKKKIYLQYGAIFIFIMVFGIINFLVKTPEVWRSSMPKYNYATIPPKDLMDLMSRNTEFIIVDARATDDFKNGYIKGATNFPYINLKKMEKALKKDREKIIVIYSEDGKKSKEISDVLSNLGFSNIKNLDGGINGWIAAGGEVVTTGSIK